MEELSRQYPNGLSYEPKPVDAIDDAHLDISNLIENDEAKRE